jgi:ParB family chromosome partitioning protein
MAEAVSLDMAAFWTPTVRSYLGRVSKARIVEAVREGASDEAAQQIDGMKKQAMAETAEQLLAGKGWLPALLRTHTPSQPAEQSESTDSYSVAAE